MPDGLLLICVVIYVGGSLMVAAISSINMPSRGRSGYYTAQRKRWARIGLTAPVWPLWIPVALTYGIYRLIQIARTGE